MSLKKLIDNTAAFKAGIASLKKQVYVGVPSNGDQREGGPIGNASLAYIHEKGSPAANIPAPPFMEPGVQSAQGAVESALKSGAISALSNFGAVDATLNKVGLIAQTAIKKFIVAGTGFKPLSESTLKARKRRGLSRTKPLIDTASLLNSITYVVR